MSAGEGTPGPRVVEVRRTYLRMDRPEALREPRAPALPLEIVPLPHCTVAEYRRLYRDVGGPWHWREREGWSDERLAAHLARPEVTVHGARVRGDMAGYFELERHADGSVEILYFGLRPEFIGRGLGGALLAHAVRTAWALRATGVWLHTCTLDAPQALPNYLARGFVVEREETYSATLG